MKVLIAIDSFKGSLSTFESGEAVKEAVLGVYPEAEVIISPLADGGEGTVEAIVSAVGGKTVTAEVMDPLGRKIKADWGYIEKTSTAVIEMAEASGITLITPEERNPCLTTTYGTGELILDALNRGCQKFIIGIGGSATNDGGVGMLMALGFRFVDKNGDNIPLGACGLERLAKIDVTSADKRLTECEFRVACDVKNPLCGKNGASRVYGPQKGADEAMVNDMDSRLSDYALLSASVLGKDYSDAEGAGAAGGLGFALISYLGARLESGIGLVIESTELEDKVRWADIVVTGEGRLDSQTVMGKAPIGVAALAKKYGKPCIAFAGCVADGAEVCNAHGIDALFPILKAPCSLEAAMDKDNAYKNLKNTAVQVFRAIKINLN